MALDPRRPSEWGAILTIVQQLPDGDATRGFTLRAVSRWRATTGELDDCGMATVVATAGQCGAMGRWDLALRIFTFREDDPDTETDLTRNYYDPYSKYAIASILAGDAAGYRDVYRRLFARVAAGKLRVRLEFLWNCLLGPDGVGDPEALVRLVEGYIKPLPDGPGKAQFTRILGAALYRAGRYQESIARIEESIRMRRGESMVRDWVFLAMSHAKLGHRAEALRWLERVRSFEQPEGPDRFWLDASKSIFRREVEAVIFYDLSFPTDPFGAPSGGGPAR